MLHADQAEPDEVATERGCSGKQPAGALGQPVPAGDGEEKRPDEAQHNPTEEEVVGDGIDARQELVLGSLKTGPDETGRARGTLPRNEAGDSIVRKIARHRLMDVGVIQREAILHMQRGAKEEKAERVDQDEEQWRWPGERQGVLLGDDYSGRLERKHSEDLLSQVEPGLCNAVHRSDSSAASSSTRRINFDFGDEHRTLVIKNFNKKLLIQTYRLRYAIP